MKPQLAGLALVAALSLSACIQLPTEKQEVVDMRPQFAFALADSNDDAARYRVFVDGLDMGTASNYVAGRNALKVLSGTHVVKVEAGGKTVVQEQVYLGDGAIRTILIPKP